MPDALTDEEIVTFLNLSEIKDRNWAIFKTNAKLGQGLEESFKWLADSIKASSDNE